MPPVLPSVTELSQREMSIYLQASPQCRDCHTLFDPYGLSVENFDLLGRVRETDHDGNAVDTHATLPPELGGGAIADALDLAERLVDTNAFARCLGLSFINFALADTSKGAVEADHCAAQRVEEAYLAAADQSFSTLIKAVASSGAVSSRSRGIDP